MKSTILMMFTLLALISCQKASSVKTNTTTNNPVTGDYCSANPLGYGCPEYCAQNPTVCGSTDDGTTTSGSGGGQSVYVPKQNSWQALYQNSADEPLEFSCPAPTGTGYDLRRGTVTLAGNDTWYIPGGDTTYASRAGASITSPSSMSAFSNNISSFLLTPQEAKAFYDTDAKLKVRFKIRPQPVPTKGQAWCYNRKTGQSQDTWGYTLLKFNVSVVGLNADGSLKKSGVYPILESTKSVVTNVGECSAGIDFSGDNQRHPHGIVLVIHDVQSDQACWYNSPKCTGYKALRQASCWQMDIEASVDGTKNI